MVAHRAGAAFSRLKRRVRAETTDVRIGDSVGVLMLPTTFMNESGQAVTSVVDYYKIDLGDILVVHDDIDLPFGKLRVQFARSAGGNNGVKSTISSLGSPDFWRLKVGVGRPPGSVDPAVFVLKPFSKKERPVVDVMIEHAADVIEEFVRHGGEQARQSAGDLNSQS